MKDSIIKIITEEIEKKKLKLLQMFVNRLMTTEFLVSYELMVWEDVDGFDDQYQYKSIKIKPSMVHLSVGDLVLYFPGDYKINEQTWGLNTSYYDTLYDDDEEFNQIDNIAAQHGITVKKFGVEAAPVTINNGNYLTKLISRSYIKSYFKLQDGKEFGNLGDIVKFF